MRKKSEIHLRQSLRKSSRKDSLILRDFERLLKSEESLDIYQLLTENSKKGNLVIPPTLLKLPLLDPMFLSSVNGSLSIIRQK